MKLRQAKKIHKKFLQVNYRKDTLYAANNRTYGTLNLLSRIRNKTLHIKPFDSLDLDHSLLQTLRDCYDRAEATRRYTLQSKIVLKNLAFQIVYSSKEPHEPNT